MVFVLEFVLELDSEGLCNEKKSQIASVDKLPLAQPLCLPIIPGGNRTHI